MSAQRSAALPARSREVVIEIGEEGPPDMPHAVGVDGLLVGIQVPAGVENPQLGIAQAACEFGGGDKGHMRVALVVGLFRGRGERRAR